MHVLIRYLFPNVSLIKVLSSHAWYFLIFLRAFSLRLSFSLKILHVYVCTYYLTKLFFMSNLFLTAFNRETLSNKISLSALINLISS